MRVLVTGAGGFVGPHLIAELEKSGHRCLILKSRLLSNLDKTRGAIRRLKFDAVAHLAGLAHTAQAGGELSDYFHANVLSTLHLCRAIQEKNNKPVFLLASTALVYAGTFKESRVFNEMDLPRPVNAYGSSKLAAEYVVQAHASAFRRFAIARSSNHTGPGQSRDFVCPGLAARVAAVKDGGVLPVGNMKSVRDFSDVRDIVVAYRLMLEKKNAETLYVLGSGRRFSIKDVLNRLLSLAGKKVRLHQEPELIRRKDPAEVISNPTRAKLELGWKPQYALAGTLLDIYLHEKIRGPYLPGSHHP